MTPPLPEPDKRVKAFGLEYEFYGAKKMREYGQLCRKQALEEAKKLCDGEQWVAPNTKTEHYITGYNVACDDCAKAIGGLI